MWEEFERGILTPPKVSIIVPVYNTEKYLHRCIDSILSQTFIDFELLLIDDGSKDSSGAICDEYASKESRICVFHKENGGVSSARNVGLDNAKGKWITFVDSDDWVESLYLEHLMMENANADLVIAYATVIHANGNSEKEFYPAQTITTGNFSLLFEEHAMSWHTSPWSKLYKTQLIQKYSLRFEENIHLGEDALFLYTYMLFSDVINVSCHTDYCYRCQLQGSLTKRINPIGSEILGMQKIADIVNRMMAERNLSEKAVKELNWLKASYINRVLNALYGQQISYKNRLRTLKMLDIDCYVHNIYPNTLRFKLYVYMLNWQQFFLYDIFRYTISLFKE